MTLWYVCRVYSPSVGCMIHKASPYWCVLAMITLFASMICHRKYLTSYSCSCYVLLVSSQNLCICMAYKIQNKVVLLCKIIREMFLETVFDFKTVYSYSLLYYLLSPPTPQSPTSTLRKFCVNITTQIINAIYGLHFDLDFNLIGRG
jgi:hypothetical protein